MQDPQTLGRALLEGAVLMSHSNGNIAQLCENGKIGVPVYDLVSYGQSQHSGAGATFTTIKLLMPDEKRPGFTKITTNTAIARIAQNDQGAVASSSGSFQSPSDDPVIRIVSQQGNSSRVTLNVCFV